MKNLLLALCLTLVIGTAITLDSCKKTTTTGTEDDSISATDAASVMDAIDLTADDAGSTAGQSTTFTGKTQGVYQSACITSIDSTAVNQITITYGGSGTCFNFIRSGTVTVTFVNGTTQWQAVGAQINVAYNSLKVTNVLSGLTYTINGSHTITNVTGGLAWKIGYGLVTNDSAIHTIQSNNISITFPNGATRTWTTINRTRKTASSTASGSNIITLSDYTIPANAISMQGTNRYGNTFTTTIPTPIISNDHSLSCLYLPYQGELQHTIGSRTATITYGTNSSGGAQGTPTICGSGFYIVYQNANTGVTEDLYVPY